MRKLKSRACTGLIFLLFITLSSFEKAKLVKMKIGEDITVMVPKDWIPMDAMDFTQRYPSVRAPLGAFTSEDRTVDFSVNISATQWPDGDLAISQKFFKASLFHMFDKVEILREGVHEVNKRKFIFFEFESRVHGNRNDLALKDPVLQYTYIQYLVEPGRTLVFSFNCPRRAREEWQETAHEMMKNITVKSGAGAQSKK